MFREMIGVKANHVKDLIVGSISIMEGLRLAAVNASVL
jgi:hypothetical protein